MRFPTLLVLIPLLGSHINAAPTSILDKTSSYLDSHVWNPVTAFALGGAFVGVGLMALPEKYERKLKDEKLKRLLAVNKAREEEEMKLLVNRHAVMYNVRDYTGLYDWIKIEDILKEIDTNPNLKEDMYGYKSDLLDEDRKINVLYAVGGNKEHLADLEKVRKSIRP